MKFKEINNLDDKSLKIKFDELAMELMKENSQVASGTTPKSPGRIKDMKKSIAKIKTALNQRRSNK